MKFTIDARGAEPSVLYRITRALFRADVVEQSDDDPGDCTGS